VRAVVSAPDLHYSWDGKSEALPGLSCSSSRKGNTLTLTVTNLSMDTNRSTEIVLRGGRVKNLSAVMLAAKDVHAHNSFDDPRAVEPRAVTLAADGLAAYDFPPASVTKFEIRLG
jgi:alpha-N-arabinofuranosidase